MLERFRNGEHDIVEVSVFGCVVYRKATGPSGGHTRLLGKAWFSSWNDSCETRKLVFRLLWIAGLIRDYDGKWSITWPQITLKLWIKPARLY